MCFTHSFSLLVYYNSGSFLGKFFCLVSSAFSAHALGALAEVAGPGLNFHLGTILPALLSAMGSDDEV